MRPKLFALLRLVVAVSLVVLGAWMATQSFAAVYGYRDSLGEPWFRLAGRALYPPFRFLYWDALQNGNGAEHFARSWRYLYGGITLGLLVFLSGVPGRFSFRVLRRHLVVLGCLLPGLACALGGLFLAAQLQARLARYPVSLGAPFRYWYRIPLYRPHSFLAWRIMFQRDPAYRRDFNRVQWLAWGGLLLGVVVSGRLWLRLKKPEPVADSHGTARWAGEEVLEQARLYGEHGVVLGRSQSGRLLSHDREEHVLLLAPPRSGKGVGVIVPTLFSWPHSVVITDIKGENWGISAGYRKSELGNLVLRFNPTAEEGCARFNPLEEIRVGTLKEVADTQNIADILVNPFGEGMQNHWDKTSYDLLVGTILHILYSPEIKEKNLATLALILSDPERSFDDTLKAMLTARHDPEFSFGWQSATGTPTPTHPVVASAARAMLDRADTERSGVKSTALASLALYRDPLVARNTSCSDFSITDLMQHEKPVSLYLAIPTSEISRTKPLYRMIMNMLGRKCTESMEFKEGRQVVSYRHRLLLLMDEFQSLGQLEFFEAALAFIAGYGIKALLVVQNLEQIRKYYGPHNSIFSNCNVRVVFTPNDIESAELISRMLGEKTELVTSTSYSGRRLDFWLRNTTHSTQEIARRLLTPGEVLEFPEKEEIIFLAGHPPIRANKIRHFKDRSFKSRVRAAPAVSDTIAVAGRNPIAAVVAAAQGGKEEVRLPIWGGTAWQTEENEEAAPVPVPAPVQEREVSTPPPAAQEPGGGTQEEMPRWARELMESRHREEKPETEDDGTGGVTL
ncbi:type IV secretory system conjugative DNA transfer family protein [Geomonas oryzisoli]|uniref:Type IV secretory system conjugative DNA transfer family protein n=1 Tax=Geomonas oryzisoli TaxID=2847992 RepID=A0ABX8J8M7_9BACT|nr:type IV secretory system conjugative DNA transfer family protein [Geomonas oryzisoli]QWV93427.1 type IV secretory system conjugative DNA transfer family protein [Geomonas oryzisoli]